MLYSLSYVREPGQGQRQTISDLKRFQRSWHAERERAQDTNRWNSTQRRFQPQRIDYYVQAGCVCLGAKVMVEQFAALFSNAKKMVAGILASKRRQLVRSSLFLPPRRKAPFLC